MAAIKQAVGKVKNNIIGAAIGGVAGYYAAKKFGKIENKWALIASVIGGVFVGAIAQSKISAMHSQPTAATVGEVKK